MRRRSLGAALRSVEPPPNSEARDFFIEALSQLTRSAIPFLVGGAFGMAPYLGVGRETKDLDIFVKPDDVAGTLELFGRLGYRAQLLFPHWLGKVHCGNSYMDVIFSSGNGVARVDDEWFAHARRGRVLGRPVNLCPPEEMIWSKAFVQERERFDGADVIHLLQLGDTLDWKRLLRRFGPYWRVLLAHIVTFGFVYPDQRHRIPAWVSEELTARFLRERVDPSNHVCYGTVLSREQYLHDITMRDYRDARTSPGGRLTRRELEIWTAAIPTE